MTNLKENKINSELVFDGELLKVYKDEVLLPNGKSATREYIKHIGAAAIFAIDNDNNVVIEEQYRYPFNEILLEVPAGKIDLSDKSSLDTAKRELLEETGYLANTWDYLGEYIPTCAYSNEVIHMYLARDLKKDKRKLDPDEFLDVKLIKLDNLLDMINNNLIKDGKTQTIILKANNFLNKN